MAAPMKRHASCDNDKSAGKISTFTASSGKISAFVNWAGSNDFRVTKKVVIGAEGSCAQYGMVAVDNIEEGELLFQIPRACLLTPDTCAIADLLKKDEASLKGSSGWPALLIALMYEYNNPQSLWRPYLDLVPDFKELDPPMFWSRSEREELLAGTRVVDAVNTDLQNLEREFKQIVLPFIANHEDKFSPVCKDIEFYKKMVAFVMAYSFTDQAKNKADDGDDDDDDDEGEDENPPPMMVPMADILNHIANNNAHLQYHRDALRMVAVKPIKKGEEVFNTYGELSNWDLLHMYGFSESYPNNHYDTVDIPSHLVIQAAEEMAARKDDALKKQKMEYLEKCDFVGESCPFVVGVEGVLSELELSQTIKVMLMTGEEFASLADEDGWIEEEEESMTFDSMSSLPEKWKKILSRCAALCLEGYRLTAEEDLKLLQSNTITSRQRYSLQTTYGQKILLQTIQEKCQT